MVRLPPLTPPREPRRLFARILAQLLTDVGSTRWLDGSRAGASKREHLPATELTRTLTYRDRAARV